MLSHLFSINVSIFFELMKSTVCLIPRPKNFFISICFTSTSFYITLNELIYYTTFFANQTISSPVAQNNMLKMEKTRSDKRHSCPKVLTIHVWSLKSWSIVCRNWNNPEFWFPRMLISTLWWFETKKRRFETSVLLIITRRKFFFKIFSQF